jgi:hypothetical protein
MQDLLVAFPSIATGPRALRQGGFFLAFFWTTVL